MSTTTITDQKNLVPCTTTKTLMDGQICLMETLSGCDFKIEYHPGREGGKPDALTRGKREMPEGGNKPLTQKNRILLHQEQYFDEIKQLGLMEFNKTGEDKIQQKSLKDHRIQGIKKALTEGTKEMRGIVLGL